MADTLKPEMVARPEAVAGPKDRPEAVARSDEQQAATMPTRQLLTEIAHQTTLLVRQEVELARVEARENVRTEVAAAKRLGVAGACALTGLNLLLVAGLLAVGLVIPEWLAALFFAAFVLLIGGVFGLWGWLRRVRVPLERTRRSIKEDVAWARKQPA